MRRRDFLKSVAVTGLVGVGAATNTYASQGTVDMFLTINTRDPRAKKRIANIDSDYVFDRNAKDSNIWLVKNSQ